MLSTKQNADQCRDVVSIGPANQRNTALEPIANMQKNMMDDMDKRRAQWEKDVERMAEDFFQVKLAKPDGEVTHQTSDGRSLLCLPSTTTTFSSEDNHRQNGTIPVVKKTSATTSSGTGNDVTTSINDDMYHHHHDDITHPEYYRDEEQLAWCRLRFDVRGYEPGEISIRVEGNRKLIVCARHVQSASESATGSDTVARQMNKTVEVPHGARPDRITSYLSKDGFLTVLAPVDDRNASFGRNGIGEGNGDGDLSKLEPRACEFRPIHHQSPGASLTSLVAAARTTDPRAVEPLTRDVNSTNRNVIKTDDGDLMLKIVLDLGRSDYEPDDITIQLYPDVVRVNARHEQQTSIQSSSKVALQDDTERGGVAAPVQTLRHELFRDFDLPPAESGHGGVLASTVRVTLGPDGRLWIGGSFEVNAEPANHRRVAGHVAQMMPRQGRPCRRIETVR